MRVTDELKTHLDRLAGAPAAFHEITLAVPRGTLQCAVTAVDAIGCAIDYVRFNFDEQHRCAASAMKALADKLCQQLRYLVEPLQVIEIDSEQPLVQARSQPPSRDANRTVSYYELLVAPQSLSLVRFSAPRGEPRQKIPLQLTREILGRLLQDLADAAAAAR